MKRNWGVLGVLGGAVAGLVPATVAAQSVPLFSSDWHLVPEACRACPCGIGGVLQVIQNLMNIAISLGLVLCVLAIVLAGFYWLLTPTNPGGRMRARKILANAAIGFVVIISAWLIVDFVMKLVYDGEKNFGPWHSIIAGDQICIEVNENLKPLFDGGVFSRPGGGEVVVGGGSAQCMVQETGACATGNLSTFGSAAATASRVCYGESRANARAVSGVDKLGDGTPYSFGLFQINITAHRINSLNCPAAFSKANCTVSSCGPGTGVRVVNATLYNQCRAAALSPQTNIAHAYRIYQQAGNSWRPWGAARQCGII